MSEIRTRRVLSSLVDSIDRFIRRGHDCPECYGMNGDHDTDCSVNEAHAILCLHPEVHAPDNSPCQWCGATYEPVPEGGMGRYVR